MTVYQHRDLVSAPFLDLLERTISVAKSRDEHDEIQGPWMLNNHPETCAELAVLQALKAAAFELAGQFTPEPGEMIHASRYAYAQARYIEDMTNYLRTPDLVVDFG